MINRSIFYQHFGFFRSILVFQVDFLKFLDEKIMSLMIKYNDSKIWPFLLKMKAVNWKRPVSHLRLNGIILK